MNGAMSDKNDKGVAVVIGAGDATGGAVARRFARAGHVTCLTRRHGDKLEPLCESIRDAGGVARFRRAGRFIRRRLHRCGR